jgi:para-nitrobenzyl esterase
MKKIIKFIAVACTALVTIGIALAGQSPTVVKTEYGKVEGIYDANNTLAWKGIPFAKPPVGDLRWKKPDDPESWGGVKQTLEFCDKCPQYSGAAFGNQIIGNEDCLYLNVWRPDSNEDNLPVYFWIHGGGNSVWSSSESMLNGANLADKGNLIVVTTNYRLGPLGWFTHPVLRKGNKGSTLSDSGNYGTLDILIALKWVRENIEAFGGNPQNVTIAGESAGAMNVFSMLLSPLAAGRFHKAIAQSGGPFPTSSVEEGESSADRVITALMEQDGIVREGMRKNQIADYLRSKTAEDILLTYTSDAFGMLDVFSPDPMFRNIFRDGTVIPTGLFSGTTFPSALVSGEYNKVPIIIGTNKEEHKLFLAWDYSSYGSECNYQWAAEQWTAALWDPIVDFVAPTLALYQSGEVYAYRFNYGAYNYEPIDCTPIGFNAWPGPISLLEGWNPALLYGASHVLDIPFFFGNFDFFGLEDFIFRYPGSICGPANNQGFEALSDAMIAYVAQFARTGDPNCTGGELWEPWPEPESFWPPWPGKRILFDADATEVLIEMSEEYLIIFP